MTVASGHRVVCLLLAANVASLARADAADNEAIYLRGHARLAAEVSIGGGADEGDAPPPFYRPSDIDVASDGSIYVLDAETCEIAVFNAVGAYRFRFAREGEGPGELRDPLGIAIDHIGNVLVYESGNRRFSWFSAAGEFIAAKRVEDHVVEFTCTSHGLILTQTEIERFGSTSAETDWALVALDSTLSTIATLGSLTSQRWISVRNGANIASATQPLYEELLWCVSPTGAVHVGRSMAYEVNILTSAFDPAGTIRRSVTPTAVGGEERAQYLEKLTSSAWARKDLQAQVKWPKHKPYMEALYCDGYGYLLVHRGSKDGKPLLDAYRPDGTFVGEVAMPGFRYSSVFAGKSVFMRVFSDDQLPAVVRYRME